MSNSTVTLPAVVTPKTSKVTIEAKVPSGTVTVQFGETRLAELFPGQAATFVATVKKVRGKEIVTWKLTK